MCRRNPIALKLNTGIQHGERNLQGLADRFRFFTGREDKVLESDGEYQPGEWFQAARRNSKSPTRSVQNESRGGKVWSQNGKGVD